MAFCKNCGTDIGDANLCPACGATQVEAPVASVVEPVVENPAPAAPVFAPDPSAYSSGMNAVSEPAPAPVTSDPFGGSSYNAGMGSSIPGNAGAAVPTYAAPVYSSPVQEKPKATGQIVFASINIALGLLFCCCSQYISLLGMLVGIAALILAIIAANGSAADAASKLKIAKILNIVAVVLVVGGLILGFALAAASVSSGGFMDTFQSAFESAYASASRAAN
jgi:hypothetical protein